MSRWLRSVAEIPTLRQRAPRAARRLGWRGMLSFPGIDLPALRVGGGIIILLIVGASLGGVMLLVPGVPPPGGQAV